MRWKCNAPFVNILAINFMLHLLNSVKLYTRNSGPIPNFSCRSTMTYMTIDWYALKSAMKTLK